LLFHLNVSSKSAPGSRHTVYITKRTEAEYGADIFLGFYLQEGEKLLPPPARPNRRIEFVPGASITAGFGDLGVFPCNATSQNEDN